MTKRARSRLEKAAAVIVDAFDEAEARIGRSYADTFEDPFSGTTKPNFVFVEVSALRGLRDALKGVER